MKGGGERCGWLNGALNAMTAMMFLTILVTMVISMKLEKVSETALRNRETKPSTSFRSDLAGSEPSFSRGSFDALFPSRTCSPFSPRCRRSHCRERGLG